MVNGLNIPVPPEGESPENDPPPELDFKHQLEQAQKILSRIEQSMDVQILDGVDVIHGNLRANENISKHNLSLLIEHIVKSPVRINLSRLRNAKAAIDNIINKM